MATAFDTLVSQLSASIAREEKPAETPTQKSRRPLKMPKNYDFSVRNVNWKDYKTDFTLRTDAVWEKSKLLDLFYTHYKTQFMYDSV